MSTPAPNATDSCSVTLDPAASQALTIDQANQQFRTQHGVSLAELSNQSPVMLLFLRHSGCTFCREALDDIRRQRQAIEATGTVPVLVHMGDNQQQAKYFAAYGLEDLHRISDPNKKLYAAYNLGRGSAMALLGPSVWWRGFKAAILRKHGVGKLVGDGFQMPGLFLIHQGRILAAYRHATAADRPDYLQFIAAVQ